MYNVQRTLSFTRAPGVTSSLFPSKMSQANIFIEFLSHINQRHPELELVAPLALALRFQDDLVEVLCPVLDAVWHQELRVVLMLEKYGATTCRR